MARKLREEVVLPVAQLTLQETLCQTLDVCVLCCHPFAVTILLP